MRNAWAAATVPCQGGFWTSLDCFHAADRPLPQAIQSLFEVCRCNASVLWPLIDQGCQRLQSRQDAWHWSVRTCQAGDMWRLLFPCRFVTHKGNGRHYALKTLKKAAIIKMKQVDHIMSEKQILAKLQHPFIVNMLLGFKRITSRRGSAPFMILATSTWSSSTSSVASSSPTCERQISQDSHFEQMSRPGASKMSSPSSTQRRSPASLSAQERMRLFFFLFEGFSSVFSSFYLIFSTFAWT